MNTYTFATLFSGGGLVDCGFKQAGGTALWAVERDPKSDRQVPADCFRVNHNSYLINDLVQNVDWASLPRPDLLHGSPMCQQFSAANHSGAESEDEIKSTLAMTEAIRILVPKAVSVENVIGYRKSESLRLLLESLTKFGYQFDVQKVNAADYGVPQSRCRLIVRAVLDGPVLAMTPTHANHNCKSLQKKPNDLSLPKWNNWYNAISDLLPTCLENKLPKWMNERIQRRFGSLDAFLEWALGESKGALFDCANFLRDETGGTGIRTDDQPAMTLMKESFGGGLKVIFDSRILTLTPRCWARLQSVEDDFILPTRCDDAIRIIGNGVPPRLAAHIATSLML